MKHHPDRLTQPENRAERDAGWDAVDRLKACGGCYCCKNPCSEVFGIALCGLCHDLKFPACA